MLRSRDSQLVTNMVGLRSKASQLRDYGSPQHFHSFQKMSAVTHGPAFYRISRGPAGCRSVPSRYKQDAAAQATTLEEAKRGLLAAVHDVKDRGIYGMKAAEREHLALLIGQLEAHNPIEAPTRHLDRVAGSWRLLYTTIVIMGSKRIKLGLKDVVTLGQFLQHIDCRQQSAVNEVHFKAFGRFEGALTLEANFEVLSAQRVGIQLLKATLAPSQLQQLFEKNYNLLLQIFNPEGWLDLTYVDDSHRVGRDDRGNIYLMERC